MVEDVPSNHSNGKLPILDTMMWIEDGQVRHSHYSKPMSSLEVVMAKSSMTISCKMNILVKEGGRRLRNHSLKTNWDVKFIDLEKLMIQIIWSGHWFKRMCSY